MRIRDWILIRDADPGRPDRDADPGRPDQDADPGLDLDQGCGSERDPDQGYVLDPDQDTQGWKLLNGTMGILHYEKKSMCFKPYFLA